MPKHVMLSIDRRMEVQYLLATWRWEVEHERRPVDDDYAAIDWRFITGSGFAMPFRGEIRYQGVPVLIAERNTQAEVISEMEQAMVRIAVREEVRR